MENYKEKYEQALERAKSMYEQGMMSERIEYIFPELKESEDERIRKEIIHLIKKSNEYGGYALHKDEADRMISWLEKQGEKTNPYSGISFEYNGHIWGMCARDNGVDILLDKQLFKHLEKQGEQKSIWSEENNCYYDDICEILINLINSPKSNVNKDAVQKDLNWLMSIKELQSKPTRSEESKFKVGDWVVQNGVGIYKIVEVCESWYEVISNNDGMQYSIGFDKENDCRLWSIQDAKDGDVLAAKIDEEPNDFIYIFHGCEQNGFYSYCYLDAYINKFHKGIYHNNSNIGVPATKEQRDLLFQKMKEAGYEWDVEEKKLKLAKS